MLNWKHSIIYNSDTISNIVPERPGVYLLWLKPANGTWKCFYAGKSETLKSRLLDHLRTSEENFCIRKHISNDVCGFSIAETQDLDTEEQRLITQYNPECNIINSLGRHFI